MAQLPVVGILGTTGSISLAENSADDAMQLVGMNTGNLLFQYSIVKNIVGPQMIIPLNNWDNLSEIKENIDVFLIPAANQINPAWDMGGWASLIEKLDKPVVIVGLGAQAASTNDDCLAQKPGTQRFVDILKERAQLVGVRGKFTQRVLENMGLHNSIITGCPSNFINGRITGKTIQQQIDRVKQKQQLSVNFLAGTLEPDTRNVEAKLFRLYHPYINRIVYQTNLKLLKLVELNDENTETKNYVNWESRIVGPDMSIQSYKEFVKKRGVFYFSCPGWMDHVRKDDLSVGMRIHGSVIANQAGSLGICVAFDSRTLELVTTMGYPYVESSKVLEFESIQHFLSSVVFSPEGFDEKREVLRSNLKRALNAEGICTRL